MVNPQFYGKCFFKYLGVLLIIGTAAKVSFSQKVDSTAIANFFSVPNMAKVNPKSLDSLQNLIKKDEKLKDDFRFHQAKLFLVTGQLDSASIMAEKAIDALPRSSLPFLKAKYYNIIGTVHANKQETKRAIQYFQKSLRLSEKAGEDIQAALMRSNIANMYFSLVDYESAYKYVSEGFKTMKNYPEHQFYASMLAVLSISEAKVGKMEEAKKHGRIAVEKSEKEGNLIAIIVSNLALGEVAQSEKEYERANEYFSKSIALSEQYQQKNFILLNSIGLMKSNLGLKNYARAVEYGEKALSMENNGGDKTTGYSIRKYLAEAYAGMNQPAKAYDLMRQSHAIFKDKNSIENKKAINDILVKYDTEKKEKELVASKNELLKKRLERSNLLAILGVLFVLVLGLILVLWLVRNRNQTRLTLLATKQEKELLQAAFEGEELERERIAHELHDGVASNLTAVRYQLMSNTNIPAEDKNHLEGILLQAHEDTRRLSHNLAPIYIEKYGFEKALEMFANENSNDNCTIQASVIPSGTNMPKNVASVVYRVAQELTQNALKHANAKEISLQVTLSENCILMVEDDGAGFDKNKSMNSNGLDSIARRAMQMQGEFDVDSSPGNGTVATFSIPLKS